MTSEHNPIEAFADGLTESLKSDEAVRREVKYEIISHLEERMLEQADATFQDVAQQFGDMELIGKDLVAANQSRLSRRNLAQRMIRYVVVPVVIIILLIGIHDGFQRQRILQNASDMTLGSASFDPFEGLTPDQRFYFEGDTTRSGEFQQQYAIYERHPDSLMWLNNAITQRIAHDNAEASSDGLIRFLDTARQKDPQNSRYDVLMAHLCFEKGLAEDEAGNGDGYTVVDSSAIEQGLTYFLAACQKPRYSTYQSELMAYRSGLLPKTPSVEQAIRRISVSASMLLPDITRNRDIIRMLPTAIEHLSSEGRAELAKNALAAWPNLIQKINDSSFTLIEVLVTMSMAEEAKKGLIPLSEKWLSEGAASDQSKVVSNVIGVREAWQAQRDANNEADHKLKAAGGIMANMLMPSLGASPSAEALTPSRMVEYTIAEYIAIFWLAVVCLALAIGMWLLSFIPRKLGDGPVLALLPDGRWWLHHLVYTMLCPLVFYGVLTRGSVFGLRDGALNPSSNLYGFGFEIMLYFAYVAWSITFGYVAWLRRAALVVGVKPLSIPHCHQWVVALACLLALTGHVVFPAHESASSLRWTLGALPVLLWAVFMLWIIGVTLASAKSRAVYGMHILRGLALQWVLVCVPLICLAMPYLKTEEAAWIKRDTIMYNPNTVGFTSIETEVTTQLREQIGEALELTMPAQ